MREGTALGYALTPPSEAEVAAAVSRAAVPPARVFLLGLPWSPARAGRDERRLSRGPGGCLPTPHGDDPGCREPQAHQEAELEARRT